MTVNSDYSALLTSAATLLREKTGTAVTFGEPEALPSPHTVLRVPVQDHPTLPERVIIKQVAPDAPFGARQRALSEYAGLEFANRLGDAPPFAPRFLGGDADAPLVVMEDMGDVPLLDHILHHASKAIARQTLISFGTFQGQMHATAFGREAEFRAIQTRLGTEAPNNDSTYDLRTVLDKFRATYEPVTSNLAAVEAEIVAISAALHDDPRYRSFKHYDAGPHNVLVTGDGLRFVDFEFSQYGNIIVDMTAVHLAFPPFGKGFLLPRDAVHAYEAAFRTAVAPAVPAIADDAAFRLAVEQACVQWLACKTALIGARFYPVIIENKLELVDEPREVERLPLLRHLGLTWLTTYLDWYGEDEVNYPYLRNTFRDVAALLRRYHPDVAAAGLYGAFKE